MIEAVDKVDSGMLDIEDIISPEGWVLLGFIMDPRTGLGRFHDYAISNFQLMERLIEDCRTMKIEEILSLPDVEERVKRYWEQNEKFKGMLTKHSQIQGKIIVTDLRGVSPIYTGNRFLIYSMFPEQNISVWIVDGKNKETATASVGHSIINRTSRVDVSHLMLRFGGGGHYRVGSCQLPAERADECIKQIIEIMCYAEERKTMSDDELSLLLSEVDELRITE